MRVQVFIVAVFAVVAGCAQHPKPAAILKPSQPYTLHIPGIGGHMGIDDRVTRGIREGGVDGTFEIYDWTGIDRGLPSLGYVGRHQEQAKIIADKLTEYVRQHPNSRVIVTCHSAGVGIAVFALEKLPADVQIDTLLMMQSALSPEYDLSKALAHVKHHAYSFYSPYDPVLDWGTRGFGTVDRVFTKAAGNVSYSCPASADRAQYAKLTQFGYDRNWLKLGDTGDHIGPMDDDFGREMLAPLLLTGKLPDLSDR